MKPLEYLDVLENVILKRNLKKHFQIMWTGCVWLWIGKNGRLL
jgi:hypothetical protein